MFDLKPCLEPKKPCSATLLEKQKRPFSSRMTLWSSLLVFPLEIKHWRLEDSQKILFSTEKIKLHRIYDAGDRLKIIQSLSQQSAELSNLRRIKTNLDTLLSDEEYENALRDDAVPSKPDQYRTIDESPMPIKRQRSAIRHRAFSLFWGVSSSGKCASIFPNRIALLCLKWIGGSATNKQSAKSITFALLARIPCRYRMLYPFFYRGRHHRTGIQAVEVRNFPIVKSIEIC